DTDLKLLPFLENYTLKGITKVICTDIAKDGMLQGASVELYKKILQAFPKMYLVASGGVSNIKDLEVLAEAGLPAVIFGKAIYEGRIAMKDLECFK
ncbi:MAG TPA: HisA/HisF-related TIM barrel protein, partial [Sedimentisphaerales bacterium]